MVRGFSSLAFVLGLAIGLTASYAAAAVGGTQPEAVFALHAVAHSYPPPQGTPCGVGKPTIPCQNYRTIWPLMSSADVYLVVARGQPGPGIAGISCGIQYDPRPQNGVDMFGWTLCADMEFTNAGPNGVWPASGGGNRITWSMEDNCQRTVINPDGVHAIAGAFYVYAYSEDYFSVTPNMNLVIPEFAVADCSAQASYFSLNADMGTVGFGSITDGSFAGGLNPCVGWFTIPTKSTTWGQLKTKY
jgi:hypothetical protein